MSNELPIGKETELAPSATLTVTKTADTNDGVCNSDCSLREAVAAAAPGDTIVFASPLFDTAQTVQTNGQITINKNLTINGRGANLTTLQNVAGLGSTSRVFLITTGTVAISGVRITDGNAFGGMSGSSCPNGDGCGGGIINEGNLTLTNVIISGNRASGIGVPDNGSSSGGGIYNTGALSLVGCTISGNSLGFSSFATEGAGIYNSGQATLTNTSVNDNLGATLGGGIRTRGPLTLLNSIISGNSASIGGGIQSDFGSVVIIGGTISGNRAQNGGGIALGSSAPASISNTTISGNSATTRGGGLFIQGSAAVLVTNSTIAANTASSGGGGVHLDVLGLVRLRNNIISGNSSVNLVGTLVTSDSNIVGNEASVRLAPLGNYGGTTPTHALLPGSSAINAGNDCVVTLNGCATFNTSSALNTDQRGRGRVGQVDVGAFEAPANLVVTNTLNSGAGSLRDAVAAANASAADESITFSIPNSDPGCVGGVCTVTLTSGEMAIANSATSGVLFIRNTNGTRDNLLISGNNNSRIFNIAAGGNLTLDGVTITRGRTAAAQNNGGAIISAGSLKILNSAMTENSASVSSNGGGISNTGELIIERTNFQGNTATLTGGAIFHNGGTAMVTNSSMIGNIAGNGGCMYNNANMNLTNTTLSGNRVRTPVGLGGCIYVVSGGALNITNSTITGNTAGSSGIGGGIDNSEGNLVRVRNSIISGNTAFSNPDVNGALAVNENNLIGGNALLAPLGFFGGTTQTHALLSSSPAINAGNNCVLTMSCTTFNAPTPLTTDQRGAARVGNVDIGAFEANSSANGGTFRATLPRGSVNSPYNFTLVPNNGTTTYAVTGGNLPPGMNLTTSLAPSAVVALTGTPTLGGIYNFSVTATNGANTNLTDYSIEVLTPTSAGVSVSGRVLTSDGRGVTNAVVVITDSSGNVRSVRTGTFGYFRFDSVAAGQAYIVTVNSKRFSFTPQVVEISDDIAGLIFIAGSE